MKLIINQIKHYLNMNFYKILLFFSIITFSLSFTFNNNQYKLNTQNTQNEIEFQYNEQTRETDNS